MPGPELTADVTGNPRVDVFFEPAYLYPETARVRMYRLSEGRTWLVRGGVDVIPGTAAIDWEAPFNVESTYRAEMFDASGSSIGFTGATSVVLEYDGTVVHQPLDPKLWVRVLIQPGSVGPLTRPIIGEFVETEDGEGRLIGAGRRSMRDVAMSLRTDTFEDAAMMHEILGSYEAPRRHLGVFCVRTSSRLRWPRTFFAAGTLSENEVNVRFDGERIQFDGRMNEARPPFEGIVAPLLTYDDLDAAYADYDERDAAYASYFDQDRDYSLAGLAG